MPKWYRVCVHGESVTIKGYDVALHEAQRVIKNYPDRRVRIYDMQSGEYCWDSVLPSASVPSHCG